MMKIFSNIPVDPETTDYSHWQTMNGDFLSIHSARSEYIENCICVLQNYLDRYPAHINAPVWENYFESFENELETRNFPLA